MALVTRPGGLAEAVAAVRSEACAKHGVPESVAGEAARITLRRFAATEDMRAERAEAYFWGIVRRRALGREGSRALRERYLAAALADEMLRAGRSSESARQEVLQRFGGTIGAEAVDSFFATLAGAA